MSDSQENLRKLFLIGYDDLKAQLTHRLGSVELASDALHDTWLRLERAVPIGPVLRPKPYLLRIAYNLALKRLNRERTTVSLDEARTALDLFDEAPDAARIVEGRSDLDRLKQAVQELTPRRRDILFASRLEGVPLHRLAVRHGISQRMVERELLAAVTHCARHLDRSVIRRFGPDPVSAGNKKTTP
jgi:RNA polymerase sigma-70 factor (ECF subfamily)